MGLIDKIWNRISETEIKTIDEVTHIEIPERLIPQLISEYEELYSMVRKDIGLKSLKNKKLTIHDIEDYFGNVSFTVSLTGSKSNDIKVLKEIKADIAPRGEKTQHVGGRM